MKAKTIIALTDGNDTASKVPPAEAAGVAKDKGIVIHTVAIGDPAAAGEDKLDEAALKDVGGANRRRLLPRPRPRAARRHLPAPRRDRDAAHRDDPYRPKRDLYWVPLAAGILLGMGAACVTPAPRPQLGGGVQAAGGALMSAALGLLPLSAALVAAAAPARRRSSGGTFGADPMRAPDGRA